MTDMDVHIGDLHPAIVGETADTDDSSASYSSEGRPGN